jgi:hypothetical protein
MNWGFQSISSSSSPIPSSLNYGLYSQTAISNIIVNTNSELSLIGSGVGSLSTPPNYFNIGDSFVARMGGTISNLNNTNIRFRIESGLIPLVDTGLIQLKQSTNQFWELVIYYTIRNIGGIGVASIISNGNFVHVRNNTGVEIFGFNTINNTTFDTTIINALDITAQWQTASPSNSINSDYFVLNKVY